MRAGIEGIRVLKITLLKLLFKGTVSLVLMKVGL